MCAVNSVLSLLGVELIYLSTILFHFDLFLVAFVLIKKIIIYRNYVFKLCAAN